MNWNRLTSILLVLALTGFILGGLTTLFTIGILEQIQAVLVIAISILFVLGLTALGAKTKEWRANPYW